MGDVNGESKATHSNTSHHTDITENPHDPSAWEAGFMFAAMLKPFKFQTHAQFQNASTSQDRTANVLLKEELSQGYDFFLRFSAAVELVRSPSMEFKYGILIYNASTTTYVCAPSNILREIRNVCKNSEPPKFCPGLKAEYFSVESTYKILRNASHLKKEPYTNDIHEIFSIIKSLNFNAIGIDHSDAWNGTIVWGAIEEYYNKISSSVESLLSRLARRAYGKYQEVKKEYPPSIWESGYLSSVAQEPSLGVIRPQDTLKGESQQNFAAGAAFGNTFVKSLQTPNQSSLTGARGLALRKGVFDADKSGSSSSQQRVLVAPKFMILAFQRLMKHCLPWVDESDLTSQKIASASPGSLHWPSDLFDAQTFTTKLDVDTAAILDAHFDSTMIPPNLNFSSDLITEFIACYSTKDIDMSTLEQEQDSFNTQRETFTQALQRVYEQHRPDCWEMGFISGLTNHDIKFTSTTEHTQIRQLKQTAYDDGKNFAKRVFEPRMNKSNANQNKWLKVGTLVASHRAASGKPSAHCFVITLRSIGSAFQELNQDYEDSAHIRVRQDTDSNPKSTQENWPKKAVAHQLTYPLGSLTDADRVEFKNRFIINRCTVTGLGRVADQSPANIAPGSVDPRTVFSKSSNLICNVIDHYLQAKQQNSAQDCSDVKAEALTKPDPQGYKKALQEAFTNNKPTQWEFGYLLTISEQARYNVTNFINKNVRRVVSGLDAPETTSGRKFAADFLKYKHPDNIIKSWADYGVFAWIDPNENLAKTTSLNCIWSALNEVAKKYIIPGYANTQEPVKYQAIHTTSPQAKFPSYLDENSKTSGEKRFTVFHYPPNKSSIGKFNVDADILSSVCKYYVDNINASAPAVPTPPTLTTPTPATLTTPTTPTITQVLKTPSPPQATTLQPVPTSTSTHQITTQAPILFSKFTNAPAVQTTSSVPLNTHSLVLIDPRNNTQEPVNKFRAVQGFTNAEVHNSVSGSASQRNNVFRVLYIKPVNVTNLPILFRKEANSDYEQLKSLSRNPINSNMYAKSTNGLKLPCYVLGTCTDGVKTHDKVPWMHGLLNVPQTSHAYRDIASRDFKCDDTTYTREELKEFSVQLDLSYGRNEPKAAICKKIQEALMKRSKM